MEDDRDGAGISGKWMNDLAGRLNETPGQRVRHSVKSRSYALAEITEIKFEIIFIKEKSQASAEIRNQSTK